MSAIKWVELDPYDPSFSPLHGPMKPWRCVDGWESHEWTMALEESRPTFACDCRLCHDGLHEALADEIEVEFPAVAVKPSLVIEHYGDDVYQWIDVTPVQGESDA